MLKRQIENTKLSQIEAAVASKKQKTDPDNNNSNYKYYISTTKK